MTYFFSVLIIIQNFLGGEAVVHPREIFSAWYGSQWESVLQETKKYNPVIDQIMDAPIPVRHSLTTYAKYNLPTRLFPHGVIGLNRNVIFRYRDLLFDFLPHELMHYQELCITGANFLGWESTEKVHDVMLTEYNAYFKVLAKKASDFLNERYTKDPLIALTIVQRYINGLQEKQEKTRKVRDWERTKKFQKQIEQAKEIKGWYEKALTTEPVKLTILMKHFI